MTNFDIQLISGSDINFNNVGTIVQPTIGFLNNFGYERYRMLVFPFLILNKEYLGQFTNVGNRSTFDLLFQPFKLLDDNNEITLLPFMFNSLQTFIKEDIEFDNVLNGFVINKNKNNLIDKNNLDEFINVMLKVLYEKKVEPKQNIKMSDKKRRLLEKRNKFRKKHIDQEGNVLSKALFTVQYKNKYTQSEILDLTVWQVCAMFETIQNEDKFNKTFELAMNVGSNGAGSNLDMQHWINKINI